MGNSPKGWANALVTRRGAYSAAGLIVVAAMGLAGCSSGSSSKASSSSSAPTTSTPSSAGSSTSPGVSATSITVGQVDDLSAPVAGLFKGAEDGTKAYFDYVNSQGGVDGRQLVLDAQDSAFQAGTVAADTTTQTQRDFALVGGFSLLDSAEKAVIDTAHMPDVGFPLDPSLADDSYVYSPLPSPNNDYPLGIFKYLKKKYPTAIKHVGILWANATSATSASEKAFEASMKSQGFDIVYDRGFGVLESTFLSDVLAMKNAGVQLFFSSQLPDTYASTVAKEMKEQNFSPINVEVAAYSNQLIPLSGDAANGMYIDQDYALYLGEDASAVPAVSLFDKWMKKASSNPDFEIESVYGWASAELFVQALKQAGPNPTRQSLIAQLDKVTSFDAGGLIPNDNPAQNIPPDCFLLAQVQNGRFVRVPPSPKSGFYCSNGGFLRAPGFTPEVRPSQNG